jgi:periplasmic divalent cation tolerance protein
MKDELVQVVTTTPTKAEAQRIGEALLKERLAACVQVAGPIISTFWWKGKITQAKEWYCVIKSTHAKFKRIEKAIRAIHSYAVPEILCFPVIESSSSYARWLKKETRHK